MADTPTHEALRQYTDEQVKAAIDAWFTEDGSQADSVNWEKRMRAALAAADAALSVPAPVADKWEGAEEWMPLAWELCADECGEDACNELVWEGGAVPEPWGDRWMKYEGEAKRLIALVRKHVPGAAPQPTPAALSVQAEPFAYWAQSDLGRVFSDGPGGMGLQWHPLYATPQPPAPVPAVPMSDEERASRHRAAFPWLE